MLGIIGGTSLLYSELPKLDRREIQTPFGPAEVLMGEIALILRHERGQPPHRINHRAHLAALALAGADRVVTIGSAGSLQEGIMPGALVIPDDYMSTTAIPSIHDHGIVHIRPELSPSLSGALARLIPEARHGGIYIQTPGPRIETVAEVRALAGIADLVGMTVASEATLARELGMECAAICTVDNYANGLGGEVLTYEGILETAREHRDRTGMMVKRIIGGLA